MPATTSIIETGVDRLVRLVNEKGKVSIPDAAKHLGVSTIVIGEWADFLEEEEIIRLEHSLTKSYLVVMKLTKKEVQNKAKEFAGKRDIFVRKAEVTINFLEKEAEKLKDVNLEFDKIKKVLGFDLGGVKRELNELHKYEQLKINLDKRVQEQKDTATSKIGELSQSFLKESKRYQQLLNELRDEEIRLEKDRKEAFSIEESEKLLLKRLQEMKNTINKIEKRAFAEDETIKNSEAHIAKLKNLVSQIRLKASREKGMIDPLVERSKQHEQKIFALQNKVLKKISEKEKKLRKAGRVSSKFKKIFDKRAEAINLIDRLNKDRSSLKKSLMELIKKAKSFHLTSKSVNIGKEISSLEKKFKEVDKKKEEFEAKYNKLGKVIRH